MASSRHPFSVLGAVLCGALLAPPALAQNRARPVETDARRDASLREAFAARTAAIVDSVARITTPAGDRLGFGVCIEPGLVVTALDVFGDMPPGATVHLRARSGEVPARIRARNEAFAVALLEWRGRPDLLAPAPRGDDGALEAGAWVLSVGTKRRPLAVGIVSTLSRRVEKAAVPTALDPFGLLSETSGPERDYARVIQHDGSLETEGLGSALTDGRGRLVGINLATVYRGTTYAVRLTDVLHLLPDMREGRAGPSRPPAGYLGVAVRQAAPARRAALGLETPGAVVFRLVEGAPAEKAGIQASDLLLSIDGEPVPHPEALARVLQQKPVGAKVQVVVRRDGKAIPFSVVLVERPGDRR